MLTARRWERNTSRDVLVLLLFLLDITFVAPFLAGNRRADELRSEARKLLLAGDTSQVETQDGPMGGATETCRPPRCSS